MHIAIAGKGTAAIISALVFISKGHSVTFYYDPKTPHVSVGESTTPPIGNLVYEVLGLTNHELVERGVYSYKAGINFIDWGTGKRFVHYFAHNTLANHFETKIFNEIIHEEIREQGLAAYIPKRVETSEIVYEQRGKRIKINGTEDYDFFLDCTGWSSDEEYHKPRFETVNSALIFKAQYDYSDIYTLHKATKDGWQFGLPFPQKDVFRCGYLYNSKFTTEEQARENVPHEVVKKFSWEPRYAKEFIKNDFHAINGNRLFFFEPLQALSLHYVYRFANHLVEFFKCRHLENIMAFNALYLQDIYEYQLTLAFHYKFGSIFDSPFWIDAQKRASEMFSGSIFESDDLFEKTMASVFMAKHSPLVTPLKYTIGSFNHEDCTQIYNGMKGLKNYV